MSKSKRITAASRNNMKKMKSKNYSITQKIINEEEKRQQAILDKEREAYLRRMQEEEEKNKVEQAYTNNFRDDETVKYIKIGNIIHDKSCKMLKLYDNEYKTPLENYDQGLCQCEICETRSYIRYAAKSFVPIKFYEYVFLGNGLTKSDLKKYFIDNGIKIDANNYELYLQHEEDNWKIVFENDDCLHPVLYHNNYYTKDGKRYILPSYHKQKDTFMTLNDCLWLIASYSYDKHKEQESIEQKPFAKAENPLENIKKYSDAINDKCEELKNDKLKLLEFLAEYSIKLEQTINKLGFDLDDLRKMVELKKKFS